MDIVTVSKYAEDFCMCLLFTICASHELVQRRVNDPWSSDSDFVFSLNLSLLPHFSSRPCAEKIRIATLMAPQTAYDLKVLETAKRGAQTIGLVSLAVVSAPVVMIACPLLGAYEFANAYDAELYTGSKVMDGIIGGLFGVVTSPLAPFYVAWGIIEELYKVPPPQPLPISKTYYEQAYQEYGLDCLNFYNIAVVGVTGTGKVMSAC